MLTMATVTNTSPFGSGVIARLIGCQPHWQIHLVNGFGSRAPMPRSWSFANDRLIELAKATKSLEEAARVMKRNAIGRLIQNRS